MKIISSTDRTSKHSQTGISAIELVVVLGIIGILSAIALPTFKQIRQNAEYKRAARDITSMLRDARNKTITSNLQYCVAFPANNRFVLQRGDRAYDTDVAAWTDMTSVNLVSQVTITGPARIAFNPNGTSPTSGSVLVQNSTGSTIYTIGVVPSGKIKITP